MMRVYIISNVFPPEPATASGTARDIADEMTRRGCEVTVFAPFPNRPVGRVMQGYTRSWRKVEHQNGYKIIRSWHTLSKRSTLASRIAENISFGITSTLQLMHEPVPDVVYMSTWPIFAQWINTYFLFRRRIPVICVVHDLYPETIINTRKVFKHSKIMQLASIIDSRVYKQSTIVTALNPVQAEYLVANRGVPYGKLHIFSDWLDASCFPKDQQMAGSFRHKYGLSSDLFLAMYVGSMTRMAGLDLYVKAAERLRHRKDIRIILVGDGAVREEIEAMIRHKGLDNIRMIYPLEPGDVPEVQAAGDVLLLSLLPGAAEHTTPSKLIYYLFSQRPVLASVKDDGPPARIIHDGKCGYVIRQGDPKDLAEKLEKLANDRAILQKLGDNARHYAEEHFLKDNILPSICDMIEKVGTNGTNCHDAATLRRFPSYDKRNLHPPYGG
jgi:glycosyltransferase involved in cell wall biosynthesis